ncbi:LysM peptidoglycan-binding domain-containing protein [Bacillus suaedaesalsae]|uniref:LysM peptidoglycan-binding domain-containing protein n=1 Tax=Bacillus suaedaesalsae TaxID=2810349 RepID=A0ABS2DPT2_9BACI|nr:LysM peptidoglycan-binding domain-containing protein [Bacillus suaedaesalsae]MBM6619751.1 LysM peptidoglycan-binding domain-containing protein [Bacillus suaedaesalsae]
MRLHLSKKETIILSLVLILSFAMISFIYFMLIKPKQETLHDVEKKLISEEALLAGAEARIENKQKVDSEGTLQLQKKLPVDPLVEQFLLDLEKAETISESFITSMDFGVETVETASTVVEEYIEEAQGNENTEEVESNDEARTGVIPDGIESVSVLLTVEAPTYFELEAFLSAIEQSSRITKVDELNFSGNKEVITTDDVPDKLTYTVRVTTFYYPKLEELKEQLPSLDVPDPSAKMNPLVPVVPKTSFNSSRDTTSTEDAVNHIERVSDSFKEHTVQSGETLYSISQKYYEDRSGEELIKEANELITDTLYAGQILKIPDREEK